MLINLSILIFFLLVLILAISRWHVHPFVALLLVAMAIGIVKGLGGPHTVEVLLQGFSDTLRWIAVIIILGAFIGEVLQETGGAFRIANRIVHWVGIKKLPWAMGITGYLVSIPVFVDVAYILFQPVTESLAAKSKKPVLFIGLSLAAGLTVSHTLIPPTPGPMAVASLLGVDIGKMLLINIFVAACAMTGGIVWVLVVVKKSWIAYDDKLQKETEKMPKNPWPGAPMSGQHIGFDILPIIVPIVLIASGAFVKIDAGTWSGAALEFISIPLVAVLIGAFLAGMQMAMLKKRKKINKLVEGAILKSALVIMITGAGGALGYVIKQTGIQNDIVDVFSNFPFLGVMLPFVVASILTISTGSITVSLVGTASMLGPMVTSLPISPEMTAALIGAGSLSVFHANASFFWLLNRLHEVPANVLYKNYTLQSLVMSLSGLAGILVLLFFE